MFASHSLGGSVGTFKWDELSLCLWGKLYHKLVKLHLNHRVHEVLESDLHTDWMDPFRGSLLLDWIEYRVIQTAGFLFNCDTFISSSSFLTQLSTS